MTREEILESAKEQVTGKRVEDYGKPENNFSEIAELWNWYLGTDLDDKDVAMMMLLMKIARMKAGTKSDSVIDACGYAACYGELQSTGKTCAPLA